MHVALQRLGTGYRGGRTTPPSSHTIHAFSSRREIYIKSVIISLCWRETIQNIETDLSEKLQILLSNTHMVMNEIYYNEFTVFAFICVL